MTENTYINETKARIQIELDKAMDDVSELTEAIEELDAHAVGKHTTRRPFCDACGQTGFGTLLAG